VVHNRDFGSCGIEARGPLGNSHPQLVSIVRTASMPLVAIISNLETRELLIAGVRIADEAAEETVLKTRERAKSIEKRTGLRARRRFPKEKSPVEAGLELLER
jgi:hypothetical protein